jgi:hypothetical protein
MLSAARRVLDADAVEVLALSAGFLGLVAGIKDPYCHRSPGFRRGWHEASPPPVRLGGHGHPPTLSTPRM